MSPLKDTKLIQLPKIEDPRGNLTVIEQKKQVPFGIKSVCFVSDVPVGNRYAINTPFDGEAFVVSLAGEFDVLLCDGEDHATYHLDRLHEGVYVPQGARVKLSNFSPRSRAIVLSSYACENNAGKDVMLFESSEGASVDDCSLCLLPCVNGDDGCVTAVTGNVNIPFPVSRVFYSYDVPEGEDRGAHAHKECHQFLIAPSGPFDVVLDDGRSKRIVTLDSPGKGLHLPPGVWASELGFTPGAICLVLASHGYSEDDYIRNYSEYLSYKGVE